MAYAVSLRKTLLTHNRVDFDALALSYSAEGEVHYGIVFADRRSPHEIVRRLLIYLNRVTADEMQNQVRYI